jgi:prefoldin alpha subunit
MTEETQLKEKYLELQMLDQSLNQLNQKRQTLENQMNEFEALKESLKDIKNSKKDSPMHSPLGSGVFIKSEIKDTDNVLVNIGSNIVIERTIEDSTKLVEEQIKELDKMLKQLEKEMEEGVTKSNKLNSELAELSQKGNPGHVHGPECNH